MLKSVCVFAGSSAGTDPKFLLAARKMGQTIAARGLNLVYGGANVGLMGAVADAALENRGTVHGVLPSALMQVEIAHDRLTKLDIVSGMHERKTTMSDAADAFVVLPGGLGTLEEAFEVWTWFQLGLQAKPVGFLNVGGFFDELFGFLGHAERAGFIKTHHLNLSPRFEDPERLLDALCEVDTRYVPKWESFPER